MAAVLGCGHSCLCPSAVESREMCCIGQLRDSCDVSDNTIRDCSARNRWEDIQGQSRLRSACIAPAAAAACARRAVSECVCQMYRGGKICLSAHFKPLWAKNVPHFGIAHALALGLAPWLAAEVPHLIDTGAIGEKKH
jgi:hypothetical protein